MSVHLRDNWFIDLNSVTITFKASQVDSYKTRAIFFLITAKHFISLHLCCHTLTGGSPPALHFEVDDSTKRR